MRDVEIVGYEMSEIGDEARRAEGGDQLKPNHVAKHGDRDLAATRVSSTRSN